MDAADLQGLLGLCLDELDLPRLPAGVRLGRGKVRDVIDLGDITTARGAEMYLALWVRLFGVLGTPAFSIKVVR